MLNKSIIIFLFVVADRKTSLKMESFWRKSPPEPGVSVKSEIEFDFGSDPEYDLIENQIEPVNMTEGELKAEVQVKSGLEADIWIKGEPDIEMKNEPESDIEIKMEFEADLETEVEFGNGTKRDDSLVRILIVYNSNLIENVNPLQLMFFDARLYCCITHFLVSVSKSF